MNQIAAKPLTITMRRDDLVTGTLLPAAPTASQRWANRPWTQGGFLRDQDLPHRRRQDRRGGPNGHRRTAGGRPGRTTGDDSAIQRGWSNPNDQLFGQVTSRTRQPRLYDGQTSRLTNTEAPKGSNLASHSEAHVIHVMRELNERPRKGLGYDTPAARFAKRNSHHTSPLR
jgi:hypothetical protein